LHGALFGQGNSSLLNIVSGLTTTGVSKWRWIKGSPDLFRLRYIVLDVTWTIYSSKWIITQIIKGEVIMSVSDMESFVRTNPERTKICLVVWLKRTKTEQENLNFRTV